MKIIHKVIGSVLISYKELLFAKEIRRKLKNFDKVLNNPYDLLSSRYPDLNRKIDKKWADLCYTVNGKASESYISPRLYHHVIEPTLNNKLMVSTFKDKNYYELYFDKVHYPSVIFRKMNGFLYDAHYCLIEDVESFIEGITADSFFIKPSLDSGGGGGIYLFERKGQKYYCGTSVFDSKYVKRYKYDFVVQERVEQHSYFSKLNPSSNNSIRVLVYRSVGDDSINILHMMLRIGAKGSYLDHDNHGGVTVAVDSNAIVSQQAYDSRGIAYYEFNDVSFSGLSQLPYYQEIVNAASQVAAKSFYARLLALDFTVSTEGTVTLLDVNCWHNGVSQYQYHNGTLFGRFTKEILEYCSNHVAYNVITIPTIIN